MTTEQHRNNPLHGVGLKVMLEELVEQYGWDILALQLKINSFEKFPSLKSAHKFLHKTQWAREKTEAFYLYKYKQLPIPNDDEHALPPRERSFEADLNPQLPAIITESDREFFDDPVSGPKFRTPFDKNLSKSKISRRSLSKENDRQESIPSATDTPREDFKSDNSMTESAVNQNTVKDSSSSEVSSSEPSSDPWGKWR